MAKEEIKEKVEETIIPEELTKEESLKKIESALEDAKETKVEEVEKVDKEAWKPRTSIGKKVKSGEINDIDYILDNGLKILEAELVDVLLPGLETELLLIGQSKGKFGGGQRRVFKQTQKKTSEGNKPHFATCAVVGNKNGYVGIGFGKSKETVPAREKAIRNAKLNIIKIRRGNGSWEDPTKTPNSIPFKVSGRCSSVRITLMPAPKGTGLRVEKECQKILGLAGIKDIWSETFGQTNTKINLVSACFDALKKLNAIKVNETVIKNTGMIEGRIIEEAESQKSEVFGTQGNKVSGAQKNNSFSNDLKT